MLPLLRLLLLFLQESLLLLLLLMLLLLDQPFFVRPELPDSIDDMSDALGLFVETTDVGGEGIFGKGTLVELSIELLDQFGDRVVYLPSHASQMIFGGPTGATQLIVVELLGFPFNAQQIGLIGTSRPRRRGCSRANAAKDLLVHFFVHQNCDGGGIENGGGGGGGGGDNVVVLGNTCCRSDRPRWSGNHGTLASRQTRRNLWIHHIVLSIVWLDKCR